LLGSLPQKKCKRQSRAENIVSVDPMQREFAGDIKGGLL